MPNLTTREMFAVCAMQGMLAAGDERPKSDTVDDAVEYADSLMRALGSKAEPARGGYGAKPAAAQRDRRNVAPMEITIGRNKGQMTDDPSIPLEDLNWLARILTENIADPAKRRFQGPNKRMLEAVQSAILDRESDRPENGSGWDPGPADDDEIPF